MAGKLLNRAFFQSVLIRFRSWKHLAAKGKQHHEMAMNSTLDFKTCTARDAGFASHAFLSKPRHSGILRKKNA